MKFDVIKDKKFRLTQQKIIIKENLHEMTVTDMHIFLFQKQIQNSLYYQSRAYIFFGRKIIHLVNV